MTYPGIDLAHGELVAAVKEVTKPGYSPIPISVVSVTDKPGGQMVVFDGQKWTPGEVAKRLRTAAEFIESTAALNGGKHE